jgi:hypothetical protein
VLPASTNDSTRHHNTVNKKDGKPE